MTKSRNRKLFRVTSSNERLELKCVDLRAYIQKLSTYRSLVISLCRTLLFALLSKFLNFPYLSYQKALLKQQILNRKNRTQSIYCCLSQIYKTATIKILINIKHMRWLRLQEKRENMLVHVFHAYN